MPWRPAAQPPQPPRPSQQGQQGQLVKAGFGVVEDSAGRVAPPVPLLPAPNLSQLPALQERPLVRFSLPAVAAAIGFRAQVARDSRFEQVLTELLTEVMTASSELRIADLPDGDYSDHEVQTFRWFSKSKCGDGRRAACNVEQRTRCNRGRRF